MFQFADKGQVWVPVALPMGGDGGGPAEIKLRVTLHTRKELREREFQLTRRMVQRGLDQSGNLRTGDDVAALFEITSAQEEGDTEDLLQRTHDWQGVGQGAAELAFTRERLAALLEQDWIFKAVRAAVYAAAREGVRKNSSPGPDGSPTPAQA